MGHAGRGLGAAVLIATVMSSLYIYPFPHTYFNTIAGGPSQGYKWLSFSNVEWGQDTGRVADYVDRLPLSRTLVAELAFPVGAETILCRDTRPLSQLRDVATHAATQSPPRDQITILVHVTSISEGRDRPEITLLKSRDRDDRIAYSYNVYHLPASELLSALKSFE